jgi:hypothetical protein
MALTCSLEELFVSFEITCTGLGKEGEQRNNIKDVVGKV